MNFLTKPALWAAVALTVVWILWLWMMYPRILTKVTTSLMRAWRYLTGKTRDVFPWPMSAEREAQVRQSRVGSEAEKLNPKAAPLTDDGFSAEEYYAVRDDRDRALNEAGRLRAELSKMHTTQKFIDEWPAMQAEIAKQNGWQINQGESKAFTDEISKLKARAKYWHDIGTQARADISGVYTERNRLVAALAVFYPSGRAKTAIEDWDKSWHNCVYIDLPTGQCSWHFQDSEMHLFKHLPRYRRKLDGHTTDEKYDRLQKFATTYEAK
jgi:hypothetical protein